MPFRKLSKALSIEEGSKAALASQCVAGVVYDGRLVYFLKTPSGRDSERSCIHRPKLGMPF